MTTTVGPMTVRYLLMGSEHGDVGEALITAVEQRGVGAAVGTAIGGLSTAGRHTVCEEVAHVADSLLGMDVSDILLRAWTKHRALSEALQRTTEDPTREELVPVSTHTVRSSHRPRVEVFVDDQKITSVELTLSLTFVVRGLLVVVQNGHIAALRSGSCEVTGALDCESRRVLSRSTSFDIPGTIWLREA